MGRPGRFRSAGPSNADRQAPPGLWRDRLAILLALVTAACLGSTFFLSKGTQFLMPGPLASAHGAIEKCSACHTKSGSGILSWTHGLVAGDPLADSTACLTCHKMSETAFNAHGASAEVLKQSTERLTKISVKISAPQSVRAQNIAFPTDAVVARDLYCATCHQEHQGINFTLNEISNEQCHSCHVVKFDGFDGHHPEFDNYPFRRRTRLIFDHAGHFDKHFREVAKKERAKRIPATCSACHDSRQDRRVMAVASFDDTCATCHLDQIIGKGRASGPKGIAFLSLPGLDLETLKKRNARIGEWPEGSEASLTPFMKVMLSRDERGRALMKRVANLNFQELANASDDEIKAVTDLAWEIKGLYYALIKGKASDVLANLDIGVAKPNATLIADLTASIPRDVIVSAQQQWLPNLAKEMANGQSASGQQQEEAGGQEQEGWSASVTEPESSSSEPPEETPSGGEDETASTSAPESSSAGLESSGESSDSDTQDVTSSFGPETGGSAGARRSKLDPPPCTVSVLGQCLVFEEQKNNADATVPEAAAGSSEDANANPDDGKQTPFTEELPPAMRAGLEGLTKLAQAEEADGDTDTTNATPDGGAELTAADAEPPARAADRRDDLLFPTEDELRGIKTHYKNAGQTYTEKDGAVPADAAVGTPATAQSETVAVSANGIESDVDPESWADYGGWYRQDYAIFYSPVGHKDRFIYSWLVLTGLKAPGGDEGPAAAVFASLTSKDAQGKCAKCHSVDGVQGKRRLVNFSPLKAEAKQGRFTNFVHEPHLGILDDRGCLTCHKLQNGQPGEAPAVSETASGAPDSTRPEDTTSNASAAEPASASTGSDDAAANTAADKADSPYLKSYEHGNPKDFASSFGAVNKELCLTCHTAGMARQDCLLCHKYHVNGVITPIMSTKLPTQ